MFVASTLYKIALLITCLDRASSDPVIRDKGFNVDRQSRIQEILSYSKLLLILTRISVQSRAFQVPNIFRKFLHLKIRMCYNKEKLA